MNKYPSRAEMHKALAKDAEKKAAERRALEEKLKRQKP